MSSDCERLWLDVRLFLLRSPTLIAALFAFGSGTLLLEAVLDSLPFSVICCSDRKLFRSMISCVFVDL